jgi:MoaA/NifB/PqqE/SkfB family radical SAM enzyme
LIENENFCNGRELTSVRYEIDIINSCNLACLSCPQGNYPFRRPAARMNVATFSEIIDKAVTETPNLKHVCLFCWSENFLVRDLHLYIHILKMKKIPVFLSTNFNIESDFSEIIKERPEYLRISVSGYFQKTYSINHCKGDIDIIKSNMYRLRYLLRKYNVDTYVEVAYHKYLYNNAELTQMQRLCDELDFHLIHFNVTLLPVENIISVLENKSVSEAASLTLDNLQINICDLPRKDMRGDPHKCRSFNDVICISADGRVLVCDWCYDMEKSILADDFRKISFDSIADLQRHNSVCQTCLRYGIPAILEDVNDDRMTNTDIVKLKIQRTVQ